MNSVTRYKPTTLVQFERLWNSALKSVGLLGDFEEIIGHPFRRDEWATVAQYLYMGAEDQSDPLQYNDHWEGDQKAIAQEVYGDDIIDDRFAYAESVYDEAGADATFNVFSGVGHDTPPEVQEAVIEFFRSQLQASELK